MTDARRGELWRLSPARACPPGRAGSRCHWRACRNTWCLRCRIAGRRCRNNYYVSTNAFYNNGATSGSLVGTPFRGSSTSRRGLGAFWGQHDRVRDRSLTGRGEGGWYIWHCAWRNHQQADHRSVGNLRRDASGQRPRRRAPIAVVVRLLPRKSERASSGPFDMRHDAVTQRAARTRSTTGGAAGQ
jgi:hypothetical protein